MKSQHFDLSVAAPKALDAIQLATAIVQGATAFLTNDKTFERAKGVDIFILDKLLRSQSPSKTIQFSRTFPQDHMDLI